METTIGITLETGGGVQSAILHVCPLIILSIPWALCLFILFMALSTSSSVNSGISSVSGLDFIVLSGVPRGHCLGIE